MSRSSPLRATFASDPQFDPLELLEEAGDVIYCLDLEGRFTYFNRSALEVFRASPEERESWLGRPFIDLLTPQSARIAADHFRRGLSGAEITPFFEVEGQRLDGTTVQLEIRASSVYRDGEIVGRQGIARDITELKGLQAEVREKSERLELLESQARTATEIYRQLAQLTLDAPADPETTGGALRQVSSVLARTSAARLGLDDRDLEVIELLAKGRSNRQIADELYLSPNTIKDRVSKVLKALGAGRRAEAVAEATRRGLITLDRRASDVAKR